MTSARQAYVNAVVANYVRLPGTPIRASRRDRHLAATLYDRRIPLPVVWAAFVITAARWAIRSPQRKLETIRTLHYFLPAVHEVLALEPEADYILYLAAKIRPLVTQKEQLVAAVSHKALTSHRQNSAFLGRR